MTDPSNIQTMRGADVLKTVAELLEARAETIRQSNDAAVAGGIYREWAPETKAQYGAIRGAAGYVRQALQDGRQLLAIEKPSWQQKNELKQVHALIDFLRSALINELVSLEVEEVAEIGSVG